LAALVLIALSVFDADRYRPKLISYLQERTGKPVDISHISVTLSPLSVRIENSSGLHPKSEDNRLIGIIADTVPTAAIRERR
jgi:hypothetical protein